MKLSICCITYNHENYISEALESFLNQNIDCEYEIIIADDASKDGTQDIIREYQRRYPSIIKPVLREKNLGAMKNFSDALKRCSGEYIAYCDGDDYWIGNNKINKQMHVLELNKACSFSFHDVILVSNSNEQLGLLSKGRENEKFETGIIESKKVIGTPSRLVHANTLLFRKEAIFDLTLLDKLSFSPNGDFALTTILASDGDCYYFRDVMATYRLHDESISHGRTIDDPKIYQQLINFCDVIDKHFDGKFKDEIQINKIGIKMAYLESKLSIVAENKNVFSFINVTLQMLINSKGSQYSVRDVLWIVRKLTHSVLETKR